MTRQQNNPPKNDGVSSRRRQLSSGTWSAFILLGYFVCKWDCNPVLFINQWDAGSSEIEFDQLRRFNRPNNLVFSPVNVFLKELYPKAPWFGATTRIWQKKAMLRPPKTTTPNGFRNSQITFARNFATLKVFKASELRGALCPKAVMVNPGLPHQLRGGAKLQNQWRDQHHPCAPSTPPVDLRAMQRSDLFFHPELDTVLPEIKRRTWAIGISSTALP